MASLAAILPNCVAVNDEITPPKEPMGVRDMDMM
jgi:hypothetical protein